MMVEDHPTLEAGRAIALFPVLLDQIAEAFGISPALVLSSSRYQPAPQARWVVAYALTQQGATMMDAARLLHRDHSTMVYGLTALWRFPQAAAIATHYARNPWIKARVAVRKLPPPVRRPVAAYARALAGRRESGTLWFHGLCFCCKDMQARDAVGSILTARGMTEHAGRMQLHARQAGLRWVS